MAERTRYLLAYDVRDPRRLRRVHRVAKDFGDPLQYSVFVCDLTAIELLRLKDRMRTAMNHVEDSVGIFDLGPATGRGIQCVEFMGARPHMPSGGPVVW